MSTKIHLALLSCLCSALLLIPGKAYSWGQKGHDVVCAVAEKHLSGKAKKKISKILDGKSLVYWANWMDSASHTAEFAYTSTWHYKDIDVDETYENTVLNEKGDAQSAIEAQILALKSGKLSKEEQAVALKILIHLAGDIHCPMHMGRKTDKGGNKYQVQYFGKGSNLHKVWDSGLVESAHNWTYTEWVEQIDRISQSEAKRLAAGEPADWGKETYQVAIKVYESTQVGAKLSYDYVSSWAPMIENQLLRGGLRLARTLNEIFK